MQDDTISGPPSGVCPIRRAGPQYNAFSASVPRPPLFPFLKLFIQFNKEGNFSLISTELYKVGTYKDFNTLKQKLPFCTHRCILLQLLGFHLMIKIIDYWTGHTLTWDLGDEQCGSIVRWNNIAIFRLICKKLIFPHTIAFPHRYIAY